MAQQVLPSLINYDEQLRSLMTGTQNFTQVIQPNNGSVFYQNSQIIFDLPNRGFIDPKSLYLRFKYNIPVVATSATFISQCPLYTPFTRFDLFFNSQMMESINDYNIVANQWINLNLGPNEKQAVQSAWGYSNTDGAVTKYDSRSIPVNASTSSFTVAGPLVANMLTGCEKFIPAFALGNVRIILTLDSVNNIFGSIANMTNPSTVFSLSNVELVYDMIDFGSEIEQQILSRDTVVIKSNSYNMASVAVAVGTVGTNTFVFNQRFASIRNAVLSTSCAGIANYVNNKFDSVDITSGDSSSTKGGSYQLICGGVMYPQGAPLSTLNNRSGLLMELRKAVGALYDWSKSMSINNVEFAYAESGATTTAEEPAKFFVGFDLNKINSASNMMLNGTSSQSTPINAIVQINNATANAHNLNLLLNYDVIVTLDPRTKQVSVLQ